MGSNLDVFLITAGLAAAVAVTIWLIRRPPSQMSGAESGTILPAVSSGGRDEVGETEDTSTQELVSV